MNEKIKALIEQADIKFDQDINKIDVCVLLPSDLDKFAELIIKECIGIAEDTDIALDVVSTHIKEHFGVK